jgi:hypothetical protein
MKGGLAASLAESLWLSGKRDNDLEAQPPRGLAALMSVALPESQRLSAKETAKP